MTPDPEPSSSCQRIVEHSPAAYVCLEGPTHTVCYANAVFCLMVGKPCEEIVTQPLAFCLQFEDGGLSLLDRVYQTGIAERSYATRPSAAHPAHYSLTAWPLVFHNGVVTSILLEVTGSAAANTDAADMNQALVLGALKQHELVERLEALNSQMQAEIVVRARVEQALLASEKRYIDLYEFAPIGYLTLDSRGCIKTINQAGTLMLGGERGQFLDKAFGLYISSEQDNHLFDQLFIKVIEHHERQTCDLVLRRHDGSIFSAQADCSWVPAGSDPGEARVTIVDMDARKQAEAEIERVAFYDPLTHLLNRRLLFNRLDQAIASSVRTGLRGALFSIDLDGFKRLNDEQGHDAGDLLLQEVALRLKAGVRETDTVARLGGDEFIVMLQQLSANAVVAEEQASHIGEKLIAALNKPYQLKHYEHHGSASIGVTLFGRQIQSRAELLKQADLALYQAKARGRDLLCFFEPEMHAAVAEREVLYTDLRRALEEHQLTLFYQPQVNHLRHIVGFEALARWKHPTRGFISPETFIPLAEECGLIISVGMWVLDTACRQLVAWEGDARTAHLKIAINVTSREFGNPHFATRTLKAIETVGANPHRLVLEFTETTAFATAGETLTKMAHLKECGICFSIDDFGIGYSSLAFLKDMPLDELKIDKSFVRDVLTHPAASAIARSIIALGKSLNLSVVAEGVETEEQMHFLALHGCNTYQGFLFGRPAELAELTPNNLERASGMY